MPENLWSAVLRIDDLTDDIGLEPFLDRALREVYRCLRETVLQSAWQQGPVLKICAGVRWDGDGVGLPGTSLIIKAP